MSDPRRPGGALPQDRVVIEGVGPCLDGGRHPVQRLIGDRLRVGADVLLDGHDRVAARLCYRAPGGAWRSEPMRYEHDPDRWFGEILLDRLGTWTFTVEAWPDRWGTWREELRRRAEAGAELELELREGAEWLRRAAKHRDGCTRLAGAARRLDDPRRPPAERAAFALTAAAADLLDGPLEPAELCRYVRPLEVRVQRRLAGFGAWYEMFPRSQAREPARHGTFADVEARLPELAELGFDVVYLPPIHPIGHTHRKGPNNRQPARPGDPGSPWAIGSAQGGHTAVHPELGTLADFERLVERARSLGLEVALDYALQCSPDHPWLREHPGWFQVRADGSLRHAENPPKKYEDIVPLDFWCDDREDLWRACLAILEFWIERGVSVFRVDNPHTKPFAFWEWLIGELGRRHPEVILLSEAFTRPKRMKRLAKLGFAQSYTYFTWKNEPWEIREYLGELTESEMVEYFRPNFFVNTPDILHEYLQTGGRAAFRVRLLLAATLSPLYGIYSGFELCENVPLRPGSEEYLDSEKYQLRPRDWDAPGHIKDDLRRLNRIRQAEPALQRLANLSFLPSENERILWYRKAAPEGDLFVAVNLDPHRPQESMVHLPLGELGLAPEAPYPVEDLLTRERYTWRGARNYVRLDPAQRVGHLLRLAREAPP